MSKSLLKSVSACAVAFVAASFLWYIATQLQISRVQRHTFQNGYVELLYPVSKDVSRWELWRKSERAQDKLITICVIRANEIVAIMPTEHIPAENDPDKRAPAAFFVWADRNGCYGFDEHHKELSSFLPIFKRAAQARQEQKPKDMVWPITFGLEQGTPAISFFSILREAYSFGEDGIAVMRDVDLMQVPVFGL